MQIANLICCRKVHDELNIFADIMTNATFIVIFFLILGLQVLITEFGSEVFQVNPKGLDGPQWGIAFAIGFSTFLLNFVIKFVPDWLFPKLGQDSVDDRRKAAALQQVPQVK